MSDLNIETRPCPERSFIYPLSLSRHAQITSTSMDFITYNVFVSATQCISGSVQTINLFLLIKIKLAVSQRHA